MKANGKKTRNRTARAPRNVEPPVSDAQLRAHGLPTFSSLVRISITSVRKRLADPDGISSKAAIDGLVACQILRSDTAECVEQVTSAQRKGDSEKTVIVIEEVASDPKLF